MVTLIKVRKDSHNIGKLLLLVELPELPTSFSYYYPFIFSLWAQGKQATVPIRLLSAHQLTLSISTSNTAWTSWQAAVMSPCLEAGVPRGREAPAAKSNPATQDASCDPIRSHRTRGSATSGGDVFLCPLWLSEKHPSLPERNAGFREAASHLAGTPNMPQWSSLPEHLRLLRHHCAA